MQILRQNLNYSKDIFDAELHLLRFASTEFYPTIQLQFSLVTTYVTLTLTRWPSYTNFIRIAWRYTGCVNMNFLRQGFQKLSSDIHTYIHTYIHT